MEKRVKPVGQQFVFEMNLGGVGVGEGVDGQVQIEGDLGDGSGHRKQPFQHAAHLGGSGGPKALRFSVPVPGQIVVAWVEDFVEHVVHGLHEVVPCAMIGRQVNVPFGPSQQALANDGCQAGLVLFVKSNEGVGRRCFTRVLVRERTGFTSTPDGSWVASAAR